MRKSRATSLMTKSVIGMFSLSIASLAPTMTNAETTITAVMQAPLRSLDPIVSSASIIRYYGFMVYDTLLSQDAQGNIKPQMLEKWDVSPDGKTYTFTLRDGLKWSDGRPVTAKDCIASIKRWAHADKMGQIMMGLTKSIDEQSATTFSMTFTTPTNIALRALSKSSPQAPFMMPEDVAQTPPTKPITTAIGYGPFLFDMKDYKPGVQAVFTKNPNYIPRSEPTSGMAGAHIVKVDKVKWISMPDSITAVNALKTGEIDYLEVAPNDLLPLMKGDKNIKLWTSSNQEGQAIMRLNHLIPPFNNIDARRAAVAAIDQKQILQAAVGDPKSYHTCAAVFGCDTKYASSDGADDLIAAHVDLAKKLLKESGYDGSPIVITQPTDFALTGGAYVPVIAQQLRNVGFNVKILAMDWKAVTTRRTSQKPVSEGGWNITTTYNKVPNIANPLTNFLVAANGKSAWAGWPDVPEITALQKKFAETSDEAELDRIAKKIQVLVMQNVVVTPLGQFSLYTALRSNINGIVDSTVPVFWNIEKSQ